MAEKIQSTPPSLTPPRKGGGNRAEPAAASEAKTFAANRATGRVAFSVNAADGVSRRARVHEDGSLRVRFPNGPLLEAVTVNSAGGMTGGDRFDFDVTVGDGASLTMTTAAAEKVYRSLGPDTGISVTLVVGANGALRWLPQETILFDRARLSRRVEVDVAAGGKLLLAEAVVFGRAAMGEAIAQGKLIDRWRVRRDGKLVFAETLRLDGAISERLAERSVAAGGVAIATVMMIPGEDAAIEAVRALEDKFAGEVGISAWNSIAVARLCAADGAKLRHDLMLVLSAVDRHALPRLWLN